MAKVNEELQSPHIWLHRLTQESGGYARLIQESGGPARAAYRLARARCRAAASLASDAEPSLEEVQAAARSIAARVGHGGALPITSVLASDADVTGLYAVHATVQGALRSLPPPAPSSQQRRSARSESRKAETRSRPSASHH